MHGNEFCGIHPDFTAEVSAGKQRAHSLLTQLRAAKGRDRRRLLLRRLLSGEPDIRLYYAYEGVRRARALGEHSPDGIRAMAAASNVYEPLTEPVDVHLLRRRGRNRKVYAFRPRSRARQLLVADVLRAIHPSRHNQFMENGGVPAALKAVENAVREGYLYAREVDICDFYPSLHLEQLIEALRPLPAAVVENTVWQSGRVPLCRSYRGILGNLSAGSSTRDTGEFPLGSAASPVAAEIMLSRIIGAPHSCSVVLNYADNFMVLGRDHKAVEEATTTLSEALRAGSSGSLVLKALNGEIYDLRCETLPFLGRLGELFGADDDLRSDWRPNDFAFEPIYAALEGPSVEAATLRECVRKVGKWHASYPGWHRYEQEANKLQASLKIRLALQVSELEQVSLVSQIISHLRKLDPGVAWIDICPGSLDIDSDRLEKLKERIAARISHSR